MDKKYSVLMVDDDKFLLEMYKRKFDQAGLESDLAVGSSEALEKLRGGAKPDVLVLDIIMPGMEGLELLDTIRKEDLAKDSLVVMLTNESESSKIEEAKKMGGI